MDISQIVFWIVAAVLLVSAVLVVTLRNLIHAALFLIVALFAVAILFVLLNAGFKARKPNGLRAFFVGSRGDGKRAS